MPPGKTLFLTHVDPTTPNDLFRAYLREFLKNGVVHLDHREIYLRRGYSGSQKFIKDYIRDNGIGTLIFMDDPDSFHFPPAFFSEMRPRIFTVTFSGDTVYYYEARDKYYAGATDLFIIMDSFEKARAFRELGGDALMFLSSYDRTSYYKFPSREKTIDVSFVGGIAGRRDRIEFIDYLAKNGVEVKIFGYGAPGGQVTLERMVEIFNKSRINLNFTGALVPNRLNKNNPMPPGTKQLKSHQVEAALCGSFALSEYSPGMEETLLPGLEMAVYTTKEELLEKIKYYLSHEQEREEIADRGYRRAVKDHDVAIETPKLLAEIEERRRNRRPGFPGVPLNAEFRRNFASFRMLYVIRFLKRLDFAFALEELALIFKAGTVDLTQLYTFFIVEVADKFPKTKAFLKKLFLRRGK
jgi:glycosyltransferase involved in cell wall biosynthesis